jgi:hypothetical protein
MDLNADSALENLTRMVEVIDGDENLRQWFSSLTEQSEVGRRNEILAASEKMRAEGGDPDLAASFQLLADPRVFEAARQALKEKDEDAG